VFNRSLAYSLTGRFAEAAAALDDAKGKLEEIEAYDDESWMIRLQRAYLSQIRGSNDEALSAYEVLAEDSNAKTVVCHNLSVLKETSESFKKLAAAVDHDPKLTCIQKAHVLSTQALYFIKKNKLEQADEALKQLQTLNPNAVIPLRAYWLLKGKRPDDCEAYLRSINSVDSLSILADLFLQKSEV
jgi:tetratricopeptide (TPR) repeat protein